MIKVITEPKAYSFVGNPIIVRVASDTGDIIRVKIVLSDDRAIPLSEYPFARDGNYFAEFDLSTILSSYVDIDLSHREPDSVITALENFFLAYRLEIEEWKSTTYYAIDGGISDSQIVELMDLELDIFSYRLNNPAQQFLFTTRTNGENIKLKESELFPFVFIHPGTPITFVTVSGKNITTPAKAKGTPCLMDIAILRKTFYDLYKELPAYISVNPNNSMAFDITIAPTIVTENKYLLRFKNSLGGIEQIAMSGELIYKPQFSTPDRYQKYTSAGLFEYHRSRGQVAAQYSLNTGYKSKSDLLHILDAVCSDRVYLIDSTKKLRRCLLTIEKVDIPDIITVPVSLQLNIEFVTKGNYLSPNMDNVTPDTWILDTGFWNDLGRWIDSKKWID